VAELPVSSVSITIALLDLDGVERLTLFEAG